MATLTAWQRPAIGILEVHGDQRYGSRPYHAHLDALAELVKEHGEEAQVLAYLHDVVEDTPPI